jgi:hypothetical protein
MNICQVNTKNPKVFNLLRWRSWSRVLGAYAWLARRKMIWHGSPKFRTQRAEHVVDLQCTISWRPNDCTHLPSSSYRAGTSCISIVSGCFPPRLPRLMPRRILGPSDRSASPLPYCCDQECEILKEIRGTPPPPPIHASWLRTTFDRKSLGRTWVIYWPIYKLCKNITHIAVDHKSLIFFSLPYVQKDVALNRGPDPQFSFIGPQLPRHTHDHPP